MGTKYLIACSALFLISSHLPGRALGCGFRPSEINLIFNETTASGTVLASVEKDADGSVNICTGDLVAYITTVDKDTSVDFILNTPLGDRFDQGYINQNSFLNCPLTCVAPPLLVKVSITDVNNRKPEFNSAGQTIRLSQSMPVDIDFSSLISGGMLSVSDLDFETNTNGDIDLSIDDLTKFKLLPAIVARPPSGEFKPDAKVYFPRIALAQPLTGDASFTLTAKDKGNPQQTNSITISVTMEPFADLEFEEDFYTAQVPNPTYTGILSADQGPIKVKNTGSVTYEIIDSGGASLSLQNQGGGVEVQLDSPIDSTTLNKNALIVVIQAVLENRSRPVVLVIDVPPAATTTSTTQSSTSTSTQSTQGLTCPTVTCPVVTCPMIETCPPCESTIATCPTLEPTTPCDCSSTCHTTPATETTSCPLTCPTTPTTCDCSSVSPTVSTGSSFPSTCPLTCPTCEAPTQCPLTCPTVDPQCPTVTPTECPITCPPPTECPITCPTAAPPTECPTTCPTVQPPNVTCPTATPPTNCPPCTTAAPPSGSTPSPTDPVVTFERQSYWAQAVASLVGDVLEVKASVANSQSAVTYSLSPVGNAPFAIDPVSGIIRSTRPLTQSVLYQFQAVARVASGQQDTTQVRVESVPEEINCEVAFDDDFYQFSVDERSTGSFGSVSFSNKSYPLSIWWTLPDGFKDSFSVNAVGNLSIVKPIEYRDASRILVAVRVDNQLSRLSPFSTIVEIIINDINDRPLFNYLSPLVIGYPERTFIDPAVFMPLFVFQAVDYDAGDNATVTYSLTSTVSELSIDPQTGALDIADSVADYCSDKCDITVTATDTLGLSASQQATILPLVADEIHLLSCKGPDSLTSEQIVQDLNRILGYRIAILARRKTVTPSRADVDFDVTLYAVANTEFVSRDEFQAKINEKKTELDKLTWKLSEDTVADAPPYRVDDLVQSKTDLTIATAVLGTLVGIAILAVVGLFVFKQVKDGRVSSLVGWNSGKDGKSTDGRRDSLTRTREFLAKKSSTSNSNDDMNGTLSSMYSTENGLPRTRIQINDQRVFIDEELKKRPPPTAVKRNVDDDTPYNPESPKPKRSIIKEPKDWDLDEKDKRKSGVKFHPSPEVIQVASTLVTEDDTDEAASDPEIEIEVL